MNSFKYVTVNLEIIHQENIVRRRTLWVYVRKIYKDDFLIQKTTKQLECKR